MTDGTAGAIGRQLRTLWSVGAVGEADDSALVARYTGRRDETAEAAFRVLVERHGSMVLGVCRQVLGDGHDAQDAAQAVFLVLARKAGSIRLRGSVAPWLHGVARRVAARARRRAAVRRRNEARTAEATAAARVDTDTTAGQDWEALHEEVDRLPEKYRAPVVLCYLEGQTYEQTARRLGCPVGTVRVRLSRARDRLRDRLTRRGLGPASALAAGWPPDGPAFPGDVSPPAGWVEATARSAHAFAAGRAATVGVVPAAVLTLGREVLRSMSIFQWKFAALGLLTAGALATGVGSLVGQDSAGPPAAKAVPRTDGAIARSRLARKQALLEERDLALKILKSSRQRLEAQRAFYEEGRITIDRYVDASNHLWIAETQVATNRDQRVDAARAHLDRVTAIVKREEAELKSGRGTIADVAEGQQCRDEAELRLLQVQRSGGGSDASLDRRLGDLEAKVDRIIDLLSRYGIDNLRPSDVKKATPTPR